MPEGIFMIQWDEIIGGTIYMKYPEDLEIPEPVIQQIQISHDFVESKITIKEEDWNSISTYNEDKQIITVLILDKYADSSDYIELLEGFNQELNKGHTDEELSDIISKIIEVPVFRTRDEVISKLSNEVAELKTWEYDITRKFERIASLDFLNVKSRIIFLLAIKEAVTFKEIIDYVKTSKNWLKNVLDKLVKNNIIGFDSKGETYFLRF
jgi:hypothetical protein